MYATVALNVAAQAFDYLVPPEMERDLRRGHLVQVPFRTSVAPAIILSFAETTDIKQIKELGERLHPDPVVSETQLDLAQWLSDTYLTPIGLCVWLMLPANMDAQRDLQITLLDDKGGAEALEREIVALLKERGGTLKGKQLDLALIGKNWRFAVDSLALQEIVRKSFVLTMPRARAKMIQTAALAIPPSTIDDAINALERRSYRADLLELVARSPQPPNADDARKRSGSTKVHLGKLLASGVLIQHADGTLTTTLDEDELRQQLADLRGIGTPARVLRLLARERKPMDVSWVYAQADTNAATLKRMEAHDLIILGEKEVWRDSLAGREFVLSSAPRLTPDQAAAWAAIEPALTARKTETFLLQGVTGSGKTEVYLRAIEATLAQGRDAILLVPEIALTAQTVRRVAARFPSQVAVYHSGLRDGERYDTWRRARAGIFRVVVGARSALFTPLPDVGLIILDEEHDGSYKQDGEQHPPQYHARAAAEELARLNNAVVILGSATPALETRYRAEQGEITHLRLSSRILGHREHIHEQEARAKLLTQYRPADTPEALTIDLPPVEVVDMREELKAGNTSIFSRSLQTALRETLSRHEQALLLMNRRGQASYVFCRDCGYVATCPRCDMPLTHHRAGEALRCHRCGFEQPTPQKCPQCGSTRIKFFGAGTQQVEEAVKVLLPQAHVLRWDADSATTPGAHEAILKHFIDRYADLIVGTQMIAKGLDLPLVTLVGVISADISLNLPDFRAAERTFQLLTQMAGRAGRGLIGGRVVLQTYQPTHYAIQAAAKHDSDGFYQREIGYRRELGYPPFRRMVRITFVYPQETRARVEAERAAALMSARIQSLDLTGTALIGPAPCFFQRVNGQHRWQLILRGPDPTAALRGIDIPQGWHVDVDPLDML
jgi:primosomal protein N' (replication factor Y) (superfamily II helicase)